MMMSIAMPLGNAVRLLITSSYIDIPLCLFVVMESQQPRENGQFQMRWLDVSSQFRLHRTQLMDGTWNDFLCNKFLVLILSCMSSQKKILYLRMAVAFHRCLNMGSLGSFSKCILYISMDENFSWLFLIYHWSWSVFIWCCVIQVYSSCNWLYAWTDNGVWNPSCMFSRLANLS